MRTANLTRAAVALTGLLSTPAFAHQQLFSDGSLMQQLMHFLTGHDHGGMIVLFALMLVVALVATGISERR